MSQAKTHSRRDGCLVRANALAFRATRALSGCFLLALLGLLLCGPVAAREAGDQGHPAEASIVGDWLVQSRDAVIRIERVGDEYEGHIVWQLHETYGPEDGAELSGKTVTDRKNPDPALRSRPLTGLRLLWGLRYDADSSEWLDGRVYDTDNGKVYHCQIRLLSDDKLSLRGYIGISLLGGNTVWTRVNGPLPPPGKSF